MSSRALHTRRCVRKICMQYDDDLEGDCSSRRSARFGENITMNACLQLVVALLFFFNLT